MIELQAIGAVKESEKVLKWEREKGVTKCSGALVLSGLLTLNKSEMRFGNAPLRKAERITMFCSITNSEILRKCYI